MCFLQPMIMRRVGDGTSHHALMQQIRRLQGRVHVLRLSNAAAAVDVTFVANSIFAAFAGLAKVAPMVAAASLI